ncbi:unnamed protein product, partial [Ascophyllum nodosum]
TLRASRPKVPPSASNGASKPKRRKDTRRKKSGRIKTPKESNEVCHRVGGVDG